MTALLNTNNRLFILARQGKRQPSALAAITVVLVILALVIIPGQLLARLVVRLTLTDGTQPNARTIVENIVGFLPVYLGLWIWLRLAIKRPFRSLGLESQGSFRHALGGAVTAMLMIAVTAGLAVVSGAELVVSPTLGLTTLGLGLLSLMAYLVQGPAEEVLFRGWLLPVIGSRYRAWIGVLVSALIFSLAHAGSHGITWLGFLNLFLFGVFAAFYALAEGGLWGICVWHAVWNWAQGDLLGFALDGTPHTGLLVSIRATGKAAITGGAFGPEGGLAATAVFLIAIGIIVLLDRANARRSPN